MGDSASEGGANDMGDYPGGDGGGNDGDADDDPGGGGNGDDAGDDPGGGMGDPGENDSGGDGDSTGGSGDPVLTVIATRTSPPLTGSSAPPSPTPRVRADHAQAAAHWRHYAGRLAVAIGLPDSTMRHPGGAGPVPDPTVTCPPPAPRAPLKR